MKCATQPKHHSTTKAGNIKMNIKITYRLQIVLVIVISLFTIQYSVAQNAAARYEIDAKRIGVSPTDKDALPRSREFIRLDSTYYVGYMYEGLYKNEHSADFFGYKNAIAPLRKAFLLMEKDYGKTLKTIFSSPQEFMQSVARIQDFAQLVTVLRECYENTDRPDSSMWILDRWSTYKFRKDFIGSNSMRAWTIHRNRFYSSSQFKFLKNSVAENEQLAFNACYDALGNIALNKAANDVWYGPNQSDFDKLNVYHYLAMLHNYNKNYDSSEYYYKKLVDGGTVSYNNYGNMKYETGNFAVAFDFYGRDRYKNYQKMMREPYYFLPMLYTNAGKPKEGLAMTKEIINAVGSTPGFGWYNIAMARSFLYDGQLDSCEFTLNKAANFKEVHIGTTLTQSQYDFSISLLRLQLVERKMALVKFLNAGWWYSPTALYQLASLKSEKMLVQYILINQMMTNPERVRIVYDLFCGEATNSFDESWYMLKDFSPIYFEKKYENYQRNDTRKNVQRYFKLFETMFKWQDGEKKAALKDYETLLQQTLLDTTNEKLFLARLYEGLCNGYDYTGNKKEYSTYSNILFETYPQLMPFTGITMQVKLNTSGEDDKITKEVISEIKDCNITFVKEADANTAIATLYFTKKGDRYEASISCLSGSNKIIANNEKLVFKKPDGVGKEIALRFFGKGGGLVMEN